MSTSAVSGRRSNSNSTLQCPRCGEQDVYALSIVWGQGSSTTTGKTIGLGGLAGGILPSVTGGAFGAGGSISSSSHSTTLAKQCAPPTKKSLGWPMAAMIFGGLQLLGSILMFAQLLAGYDGDADPAAAILGVIIGPLLMYFGYHYYVSAQKYNESDYPKLLQEWRSSFICLRCGNRFEI
jgi:hypothetical protein